MIIRDIHSSMEIHRELSIKAVGSAKATTLAKLSIIDMGMRIQLVSTIVYIPGSSVCIVGMFESHKQ